MTGKLNAAGERLRVVFVAGTLGRGGAETQLLLMARALQSSGVDVRVVALDAQGHFAARLTAHDIPVVAVDDRRVRSRVSRAVATVRAVTSLKPDVVQASHFYVNAHATAAAWRAGAMSIGAVRGDGIRDLKGTYPWGPWLLRLPNAVVCNSVSASEAITRAGRSPASLHVLANVLDLEAFDEAASAPVRPAADSDEDPFHLVLVARLLRVKRVDRFISALKILSERRVSFRASIAGDGPERPLIERQIAAEGLARHVSLIGESDRVPALLRSADVAVLTSECEGCPNVLLEAMAARCSIVSTPAGDASRLVTESGAGYVVPHDDPRAMADRLATLAADRALRGWLGEQGRRYVERAHDWRGLSGRLLGLYEHIAAAGRSR